MKAALRTASICLRHRSSAQFRSHYTSRQISVHPAKTNNRSIHIKAASAMPTSRYAQFYVKPNGAGDSRPTAIQIVEDEDVVGKLKGKVILITGCSSGLGIETARALSKTGATLYLTARDVAKAEEALKDVLEPGRVSILQQDLSSFASVRKSAEEFLSKEKTLNILVANAGVMAVPERRLTTDGYEMQFGTNHLGHFLLFNLLKDALLKGSSPELNSRVVMVSSSGHRAGGVHFGNYNLEPEKGTDYSPYAAYGQSKTANIYMANYIDRHFGPSGIHANSLMPGGIWTPLQRHWEKALFEKYSKDPNVAKQMRSAEQGAATSVWAAVGKEWEGRGGKYLEDCQEAPEFDGKSAIGVGWVKHAFDQEKEDRLWRESLKIVGLQE